MTANESVIFAKLQQLDFCLELAFVLICSGLPKDQSEQLLSMMVTATALPDLAGAPAPETTEDEQLEAMQHAEAHRQVVDFVERVRANESEFRAGTEIGSNIARQIISEVLKSQSKPGGQ